jgi:hypothetical protein
MSMQPTTNSFEAQNLLGCTALMMEAARASETSVDIQLRTRQYLPEDSELHTRRRENLKSHKQIVLSTTELLAVTVFKTFNKIKTYLRKPVFIERVLSRGSRVSSGSIVSDYGLDDRGSIPGRGKGFFLSPLCPDRL